MSNSLTDMKFKHRKVKNFLCMHEQHADQTAYLQFFKPLHKLV